jgi:exodeoxyribonuclease VII large subunit
MFQQQETFSVSELTRYIRDLFDSDAVLQDVWVTGEVSNMHEASSGHWYFTIKDNDSQLRCVMWRSATSKQSMMPQDGDALEVHGSISVYEPRGEYQIYADIVRPVGVGRLYQEFERLKLKLAHEGLFDEERKRKFPTVPRKIGVVTSPGAAAFQDIQNVLKRRCPLVEVILSPTMVQGVEAPVQIINAIGRLNAYTDADVILVCRGGGSIEDLWAFNNEDVARAVAGSRIPIITGVGHETDFTIVDFVSDLRAPTPSAAAELATPDVQDMRQDLYRLTERLIGLTYDVIFNGQNDLDALGRRLDHVSPVRTIEVMRQRVDDLSTRMTRQQQNTFTLVRERLQNRLAALHAASPQAILARGYAIITRTEDGQRVISEYDARPGTGVTIQLRDGELYARMEDKDTHERYKRTLF